MLNMQRCIEKITSTFNEREKLSLLKSLQEMYDADEKYDTMEHIGFESIRDVLMLETDKANFTESISNIDPIKVFSGQLDKQMLVLESMFDAAIVDSIADEREADCLIKYILRWNITLDTVIDTVKKDLYYYLDLGLSEVHTAFIDLLQARYPEVH